MSAPFERLLYTDCRPGEGRDGAGGLQVQAQSAGVTNGQVRLAKESLLYSAQAAWVSGNLAVEEFPLGFAHAVGEGWGTAESRYLGQEANGTRSGNHLADCLLTTDHTLYGAIRPAQLWLSDFWRAQPFNSTDCPAFDGFLEPGPLTNDALIEWLLEHPARPSVLSRIVTNLETPGAPRIVISAEDPSDALRWVALATMLLPIRAAVDVTFKVFVGSLNNADQRIVAVPRRLNPDVLVGRSRSDFVVDATADAADDGVVADRARFWVDKLVSADDAYDVLDAIELAETLGGADDRHRADARETAWALISEDALADPAPLIRWLTQAAPEARRAHGSALIDRILGADVVDARTLRWIDSNVAAGVFVSDRNAVRLRLLAAEIDESRAGASVPPDPIPDLELDLDSRRDAESLLTSAMLLEADDELLERLLRLASRYKVALSFAPLNSRLTEFVDGWVSGRGFAYTPEQWALADEILDLLHARLTDEVASRGTEAVFPVLKRVWPYLLDRSGDASEPLNWQMHAAALGETASSERYAQLQQSLASLNLVPAREVAIDGFQHALLQWRVLTPIDSMSVAALLPLDVPLHEAIATHAASAVQRHASQPNGLILAAAQNLHTRRQLGELSEQVHEVLLGAQSMNRLLQVARAVGSWSDLPEVDHVMRRVISVQHKIVALYLEELVGVCLDSKVSLLGSRVMSGMIPHNAFAFLDVWARELRSSVRWHRASIYAVSWYDDTQLSDAIADRIADIFASHAQALAPDERAAWLESVVHRLSPELQSTWRWLAGPRAEDVKQAAKHDGKQSRWRKPRVREQ